MNFLQNIESYHLDVLQEIGNIGAAHAATALSELLNKQIEMSVPDVKLVPIRDLPNQVGGSETEVAAIFLRIEGEAPGSIFFISEIEEVENLVRRLTNITSFQLRTPPFDDLGLSAYLEVGNILGGSYLSSLADFTRLTLHPSVPGVSVDMAGAILNYGLISISEVGDYAIVIDTEIKELGEGSDQMTSHFFLLPDPDAFITIFQALGVDVNE